MADLDDLFTDPNGPAYQKREERTGPPLDYVAEKLRNCLVSIHHLNAAVEKYVPADLPAPGNWPKGPPALRDAFLFSPAQHAFHYGVVAYLALFNLLALANDHNLTERLLRMTTDEFGDWMARIQTEGSVSG